MRGVAQKIWPQLRISGNTHSTRGLQSGGLRPGASNICTPFLNWANTQGTACLQIVGLQGYSLWSPLFDLFQRALIVLSKACILGSYIWGQPWGLYSDGSHL